MMVNGLPSRNRLDSTSANSCSDRPKPQPSAHMNSSSPQLSRGTASPMDFAMDLELTPGESSPWLLAVSKLSTPSKQKPFNSSPFYSTPNLPSFISNSAIHPNPNSSIPSYSRPAIPSSHQSCFSPNSFGQTRAGDLFSSTGIAAKNVFQFGVSHQTHPISAQIKPSPIKAQPVFSSGHRPLAVAHQRSSINSPSSIDTGRTQSTSPDKILQSKSSMKPQGRKRKKTGELSPQDQHDASNYHQHARSNSIQQPLLQHMHLPYLITGYIQALFTLFIVCVVAYILVQFIWSVRHDLQLKTDEFSQEMTQQIALCSKSYYENKCMPGQRVPAMYQACTEWEICMSRDPKDIARLKVGAETLAEILNKLINPLSYKTMIFGALALFGTLLFTSSAFSFFKRTSSGSLAKEIHHHHHSLQSQYPLSKEPRQGYFLPASSTTQMDYNDMNTLRFRNTFTNDDSGKH
ncbi:hypothetical protein O5D80_006188 [Batrachochytrium dendrobatidis]|nr:hypothetical protein O5D80_006188 [Batrachochytrium dendrobatidis]